MTHFKKFSLSVSLLLIAISAVGQTDNLGYTMGLKVGPGILENVYIEGIDLNLTSDRFIYSATYNYNRELDILTPNPQEEFNQVNLLFGSFYDKNSFRFEYQGGIGMTWGLRRTTLESDGFLVDNYNSKEFETISLPIRGSIKYIPFNFMSVGLDLLININPEKTFAIPMLTLNFGRIIKEKR